MKRSRREFMRHTSFAAIGAPAVMADVKTGIPTRVLGRTGARVSILAFGCGSRFLQYPDEESAVAALNLALDRGITYVDTAFGYGDGLSETRVGKVMKTRRNGVWLATKVLKRNGDEAMQIIEGSLKRLQTDHLDLIHIHSLSNADDLKQIEAHDGVLKRLYQLRDQKVTRAIGITSHTDPVVLKTALERHDFDCTQMALNAARAGMARPDGGFGMTLLEQNFESTALPVAKRKNLGVIAMKIFAQGALSDKTSAENLIRYALTLPVSAAVIGMPNLNFLQQNIAIAKDFQKLGNGEMRDLSDRLSSTHKAQLDRFFHDHVDA
jgi:aryl-alcohol dehydrogenase-like predicted oxidoreductase